mmetsp:Transcript_13897/g.30411  ORF Transcript_13897/g.30411 Transcript_13897/m.30411 type:complete len:311 (-) Transcript_13897:129-1061(-)
MILVAVLFAAFASVSSLSVSVFGGTGFVGSRVAKLLVEGGADVTSISRSGSIPDWAKGADWVNSVQWKSVDFLSADAKAVDAVVGNPDCVVSCLGVVGTDPEVLRKGNGDANKNAFSSAERGGSLKRAAFVSVSSEVDACKDSWLPEFFKEYFEGKGDAEEAAQESVGGASKLCVVKPTFIYGGDSFAINPPRVTFEYGSGIEELLMLPPIKILADITPGLIKVALRPPVCVDSVAGACAKAVLDESGSPLPTLDGTVQINEYSGQSKATGLTDAITWSKGKLIDFYDWAKVEVPKAIDWTQKKIDELQK